MKLIKVSKPKRRNPEFFRELFSTKNKMEYNFGSGGNGIGL